MLSSCRYIFGKRPGAILRRRLCLTNRPRTPLLAPRFWRAVSRASTFCVRCLQRSCSDGGRAAAGSGRTGWYCVAQQAGPGFIMGRRRARPQSAPAGKPSRAQRALEADLASTMCTGSRRLVRRNPQLATRLHRPRAGQRPAATNALTRDFHHASACSGDSCATRVPFASKRCTLPASSPQ